MVLATGRATIGEKRVTFYHLNWQSYQQILTALGEHRAARLTYDRGTLEITMPLEEHESAAEFIGLFIRILVVEMRLKMKSLRSSVVDRRDLDRGAEPDNCYYIQNQPKVAGRIVNLDQDPPPDLIVEVDITNTDIDKNRLYAALGIPEFWRFDGELWRIYQLQDTHYGEVDRSPTFPIVEKTDLYQFLAACQQDEVDAELTFREWVKQRLMQTGVDVD